MQNENESQDKIKMYKYLQYTPGSESMMSDFLEKDENLIENKIFKSTPGTGAINKILKEMEPYFQYGNNKLKYLQTEYEGTEYLSLVLMSTKFKLSLKNLCFANNQEERKPINSFVLLFKIACEINKLHKNNIIHGCIRPENIYLDSKGNPQVVNYGLRIVMDKYPNLVNYVKVVDSRSNPEFLSYMKLKGTQYEPPEMRKIKQFAHSNEIEISSLETDLDYCFPKINNSGKEDEININDTFYTAKMDVFSYGILFYEIMSRKLISVDKLAIKNGSIFPGDRHFPDAIRNLINQCLSIDPSKRPSFPAIISCIKKICDDNQYNLMENDDKTIEKESIEIPFDNPPNDIKMIFDKAFQGDVENCLVAFHILRNYDNEEDNYGVKIENGMMNVKVDFLNFLKLDEMTQKESDNNGSKKNDGDDNSGIIKINENTIYYFPKKISVPLLSYEISSLTSINNNKYNPNNIGNIERCYQKLKEIALNSKDPNLLLYLALPPKIKESSPSRNVSRSPSIIRSTSRSQSINKLSSLNRSNSSLFSSSPSLSNLNQPQQDEIIIWLLREASKYGSSDALVFLGCLDLIDKQLDCNKESSYNFKVAADMYNPYGMVNFGISLQEFGKKTNDSSLCNKFYALAGDYYKMTSQSRLKFNNSYIGLELYNNEIEEGLVDDEASRKYDIGKKRWVDWFLTMPSGRLFAHASEDFISKSDKNSSSFQSSHQNVEETYKEMAKIGKSKEEVRELDYSVAQEYGRDIHTLYSYSAEFIKDFLDKYLNTTDFPRCPRVLCFGQACFPVGPLFTTEDKNDVQELNENMCVHFYCPRCNDYYLPSQVMYRNIPGIYFPRNYLPKALKELYKIEKFRNERFIQYVPTIFGIPMMEAKPKSKKSLPKDEASDAAGFFKINDSNKNKDLMNEES